MIRHRLKRPPIILLALLAGALAARAGHMHQPAAASPGHAAPPPLQKLFGGPFTLTDQHGKTRSDKEFRGRFMLIFFGYTHCPLICPTSLATISAALEKLPPREAERIVPVFITVDPERDTPAVLKDYARAFHPRLVALTGTPRQIARAARAFRVHRRKILPQQHEDGHDYHADHGSLTYLMGPDGRFRTLFPYGISADTLAQRLHTHVAGATARHPGPATGQ